MRKYTFIGTEQERLDYSSKEERRPQKGKIYRADELVGNSPISYWVSSCFSETEWQEVFEEEKVQLTETEKIVLIDFLNDHFEEFVKYLNYRADFDHYERILGEFTEDKASNLIDKIERLC